MRSWEHSCHVLCQIWTRPITTKSDSARNYADTIQWATARGYLTTEIAPWTREYGNLIKVTQKGLLFLEECFCGLDRDAVLSIVDGKLEEETGIFDHEVRID